MSISSIILLSHIWNDPKQAPVITIPSGQCLLWSGLRTVFPGVFLQPHPLSPIRMQVKLHPPCIHDGVGGYIKHLTFPVLPFQSSWKKWKNTEDSYLCRPGKNWVTSKWNHCLGVVVPSVQGALMTVNKDNHIILPVSTEEKNKSLWLDPDPERGYRDFSKPTWNIKPVVRVVQHTVWNHRHAVNFFYSCINTS